MTTVRTYISAIILSCVFFAIPTRAIDESNNQSTNLLTHVWSSLPSMQNISDLAIQTRDVVVENRYIAAPALAIVLIGSYLYLRKLFFRRKVRPSVKEDAVSKKKVSVVCTLTAAKQKKDAPIALPVQCNNKAIQTIKVVNDQDQSLNICVSKDNGDSVQQFSVPSRSCDEINIKK